MPGLIAVAQASAGSVENIRGIDAGLLEGALAQADIAYSAALGHGPFADEPTDGIRAIAHLYTEALHVVVRADSDIETLGDLAGRQVSLGREGSGTLATARLVLGQLGIDETDLVPVMASPERSADLLREGEIDAFFIVGGAPLLVVEDLASRMPIRLLPLDGAPMIEMIYERPYMVSTTIAEGVYDGVGSASTVGVGAILVVATQVDDETAYGITRALWHPDTLDILRKSHRIGASMEVSRALDGLGVPAHPGAIDYYREIGLSAAISSDSDAPDPAATDGDPLDTGAILQMPSAEPVPERGFVETVWANVNGFFVGR